MSAVAIFFRLMSAFNLLFVAYLLSNFISGGEKIYGQYITLTACFSLLLMPFAMATNQFLTREYGNASIGEKKHFLSTSFIVLTSIAVFALAIMLLSPLDLGVTDVDTATLVCFASAGLFSSLRILLNGPLRNTGKYFLLILTDGFVTSLFIVISITSFVINSINPSLFVLALIILVTEVSIVTFQVFWLDIRIGLQIKRTTFFAQLKSLRHRVFFNLLTSFQQNGFVVLVSSLSSPEVAGIYRILDRIAAFFYVPGQAMMNQYSSRLITIYKRLESDQLLYRSIVQKTFLYQLLGLAFLLIFWPTIVEKFNLMHTHLSYGLLSSLLFIAPAFISTSLGLPFFKANLLRLDQKVFLIALLSLFLHFLMFSMLFYVDEFHLETFPAITCVITLVTNVMMKINLNKQGVTNL